MKINSLVNGAKNGWNPIIMGLLYTFAIVMVLGLIVAIIMYITSLSDAYIPVLSYIITAIALIFGGAKTGKHVGEKGWYYGGLTGFIYGLLLIAITFLAFNLEINLRSIVLLILTFLFGAFGGIFGVNTKK